jgi:hypothetical protein
MTTAFRNRAVYSFDTWAPAILGSTYQNVTVCAIFDEETAQAQGLNTKQIHASVFSSLPLGTPNDSSAYDYIQVKTESGEKTIFGIAWLKETSIQEITLDSFDIRVSRITASDLPRLRNALFTSGFDSFEIKRAGLSV